MKALLVRVGADQSVGGGNWNGPIDKRSNEFVYVSIPETQPIRDGLQRPYAALTLTLSRFGVSLPAHLRMLHMHLDPDFDYLTYGDQGQRAQQLCEKVANKGDVIVFYAGLKDASENQLIYAIIGLFFVEEITLATNVALTLPEINAHSRRVLANDAKDIVVRAQPTISGRLQRGIPIGELRDGAYRVRRDVLETWGGLSVRDGYLQRSARLPEISNPKTFLDWFYSKKPTLLQANN